MTVLDTGPAASHRERKKRATRQALHDAAFDLVRANGLHHTTIEAISERAGVAPRTFWSYFASKEDAVLDTDPGTPDRLCRALLDRPDGEDPLSSLRRVLEDYLVERALDSERARAWQRLIHAEPDLMATAAASYDDLGRALASAVAIRVGLDDGEDLLPGVLVMAACGACRVALKCWAEHDPDRSLVDLIEEAFARLADGLAHLVLSRPAAVVSRGRPV